MALMAKVDASFQKLTHVERGKRHEVVTPSPVVPPRILKREGVSPEPPEQGVTRKPEPTEAKLPDPRVRWPALYVLFATCATAIWLRSGCLPGRTPQRGRFAFYRRQIAEHNDLEIRRSGTTYRLARDNHMRLDVRRYFTDTELACDGCSSVIRCRLKLTGAPGFEFGA